MNDEKSAYQTMLCLAVIMLLLMGCGSKETVSTAIPVPSTGKPVTPAVPTTESASAVPMASPGAISPATVARLEKVNTLSGHTDRVPAIAFSPDGVLLASVGPMTEVKLWDVESGQVTRDLGGHNGNVFGVAFSVDGSLLASSSDDGTMKVWDVESGRALRSFRHGGEGSTVAFSPDGSLLACDGSGNTIILWGILD